MWPIDTFMARGSCLKSAPHSFGILAPLIKNEGNNKSPVVHSSRVSRTRYIMRRVPYQHKGPSDQLVTCKCCRLYSSDRFWKKLKCVGTCLGAQVNFWKKIVLLRKHLLFDLCGNLTMSCSKPRTDFMPLADYILRTLYLACYEFFPPLSSSSVVQRKNGTVNSNVPPPE